MTITTKNSTYTLVDRGDGAVLVTSTNSSYPGPYLMIPLGLPRVGHPFFLEFRDGPRKGRTLMTSPVTNVRVDQAVKAVVKGVHRRS